MGGFSVRAAAKWSSASLGQCALLPLAEDRGAQGSLPIAPLAGLSIDPERAEMARAWPCEAA